MRSPSSPSCRLKPTLDGSARCTTCGARFAGGDLDVVAMRRVEGGSDPEQNALSVYVELDCPRGRSEAEPMRLGYGPTACPADGNFLLALQRNEANSGVATSILGGTP